MIIVYIFGILYDLIMQFQPLQTDESSKNNNNIGNVLRSTLCSVVSPFWSTSYFCLFASLCTFFLQHFKGFATAVAETTTTTTLSIHCYYLLWPKSNTYLTRAVEDECTFVYKYVYFTRLPFHFLSLRSQSDQLIIPYTKHNYTHAGTHMYMWVTHAHVHVHMHTKTTKIPSRQIPSECFFQFLPFKK